MKTKENIRYIFFGILTVIVNLLIFYLLAECFGTDDNMTLMLINAAAFVIAVLFAYYTNTVYVFRQKCTMRKCVNFFYARIFTLAVENAGLLTASYVKADILTAKYMVSVLVIILNYVLSKFWIYKEAQR